ncbi:hypothetical protein TcCL_Unassigned06054 [Trypanosoma cruzi]|nr:hypothetical protein TcCL_Unassigned06054 [Trypanosoma cruzi]
MTLNKARSRHLGKRSQSSPGDVYIVHHVGHSVMHEDDELCSGENRRGATQLSRTRVMLSCGPVCGDLSDICLFSSTSLQIPANGAQHTARCSPFTIHRPHAHEEGSETSEVQVVSSNNGTSWESRQDVSG